MNGPSRPFLDCPISPLPLNSCQKNKNFRQEFLLITDY
jgi:hypothetical protein